MALWLNFLGEECLFSIFHSASFLFLICPSMIAISLRYWPAICGIFWMIELAKHFVAHKCLFIRWLVYEGKNSRKQNQCFGTIQVAWSILAQLSIKKLRIVSCSFSHLLTQTRWFRNVGNSSSFGITGTFFVLMEEISYV